VLAPRLLISEGPDKASLRELEEALIPMVTVDGTGLDFGKLRRGCEFAVLLFSRDMSEVVILEATSNALGPFGPARLTLLVERGGVPAVSLGKTFTAIRICEISVGTEGAAISRVQ